MLGLILLYFIGKYFYKLAEEFGKSKWGFAILGVASYYVGTFLGGVILAIIFEIWGTGSVDGMSDLSLGLIALPFGLATAYGVYILLKKIWKKNANEEEVSIDDIGKS